MINNSNINLYRNSRFSLKVGTSRTPRIKLSDYEAKLPAADKAKKTTKLQIHLKSIR